MTEILTSKYWPLLPLIACCHWGHLSVIKASTTALPSLIHLEDRKISQRVSTSSAGP